MAGNLVNNNGVACTFNLANQINGLSYDPNGNLLSDGQNSYAWDRANRLTTFTGSATHHYAYDGQGNRRQQTVGGVVTNYLLDLQPGLAKVVGRRPDWISATTSTGRAAAMRSSDPVQVAGEQQLSKRLWRVGRGATMAAIRRLLRWMRG